MRGILRMKKSSYFGSGVDLRLTARREPNFVQWLGDQSRSLIQVRIPVSKLCVIIWKPKQKDELACQTWSIACHFSHVFAWGLPSCMQAEGRIHCSPGYWGPRTPFRSWHSAYVTGPVLSFVIYRHERLLRKKRITGYKITFPIACFGYIQTIPVCRNTVAIFRHIGGFTHSASVRVNKEWCQNTVLLVPVSICRVCKGQESTFFCKGFSLARGICSAWGKGSLSIDIRHQSRWNRCQTRFKLIWLLTGAYS